MTDKWEFMKGNEVVYSSALDIMGEAENIAWDAAIQAVGKIFARHGWNKKLGQLDSGNMIELVMVATLEFEKVMQKEKKNVPMLPLAAPGEPEFESDDSDIPF
jgi:hypothetical protein